MSNDLAFYYRLLLRRLPVMIVIVTLCAGIGIAVALTLPPKYSADATLLVEGAQIPDELAASTVRTEAKEQLQIIQQRLMTRTNLVDIANKFRVFAGESGLTPDDVVERMREQTSIRLTAGRDGATFMSIAFSSGNGKTSADVVNEFVTIVLAADTKIRTGGAEQTLAFFEQQVERLNSQLSRMSAQIVAFKEENKGSLPEGLDYRLDRQSTLQERLNLVARDKASLVDQRDRLIAVGAAAAQQPVRMTPEQQQLARLNAELVEWESVLSGTNPKVKVLKAKIAELEKRIDSLGRVGPSGTGSVLELQLAEIDSRISFADQEIERTEAELAALRQAIEATPKVAIHLEELEREYQNIQTLYNQAVAARATAQTGEQIELTAKGERISVIEQAATPSSPTSPRRKLIAGGGIFAGAALASLFYILSELLNRAIRRPVDLTRGLGIQPLVTIPYIEEESTRQRRRAIKTIAVVGALIAIPFGLWAIHTFYLPLDLLIANAMTRVGL
ncbi:MAG: lipopolysaccharide biosynthesis [Silicimonas sp.]|nr:lipopolysaccharide biosynthesis [Silicimonas sp.]